MRTTAGLDRKRSPWVSRRTGNPMLKSRLIHGFSRRGGLVFTLPMTGEGWFRMRE